MTQPVTHQYIEEAEGAYRVSGSRVCLDSIVWAFLNGQSAASIAQSFPALTLEQVAGALTFDLAHRAEIDAYLAQGQADPAAQRRAVRAQDPS